MTKTAGKIRFKARLLRPADKANGNSWTFLILPKNASAKLPSRGVIAIEGKMNGFPFEAMLQPDGQKGHWLKIEKKLQNRAGAAGGDEVNLETAPATKPPEPKVPADLRKALAAALTVPVGIADEQLATR